MAQIGVQLMMLREQVQRDGAYDVLSQVRELGFRSVEVSQIPMTPENVQAMRRVRDETGMTYAALSASVGPTRSGNDSLTENYDKIISDAKTLDATSVRIGMMPFEAMQSEGALKDFCKEANEAALRLAEDGVGLYYHNHHIEFAYRNGQLILDQIREWAPDMRLEIDVHWVQRGGKDPVRTLEKYSGLVDLVHLKDYRIGEMDPAAFELLEQGDVAGFMQAFTGVVQFAEVGEGTLEWREVIEQALTSGAEYLLIEQDDQYGRHPMDCLKTSRDNLVALGYEHLL